MLKKIWEIIEDIAGRNDKEKEQDAIKVQQNVEISYLMQRQILMIIILKL